MAIDSRIALAGKPLNIGQRVAQNVQNLQQVDLLNQRREQAPFQNQLLQLQTELAQAQQPANLQQAEFAASGGTQLSNQQQQAQQIAASYANALRPLLNNPQALVGELQRQKQQFQSAGVDTAGIDEDILQAQTPEGLALLAQEINDTLMPAASSSKSVSQREHENLVGLVKADPKLTTIEAQEAARKLGRIAKVSTSAAERIAVDDDLSTAIADAEGKKATATEEAKLQAQKKFKPQITKAIKLAEKEATEKGDVLNDLARAEAGLPGLITAMDGLKELAGVATSTYGGRFFDAIAKETGFGSTKGANARVKYIAIIDNQVLPLLKQTFGGAMTEGEGLRLSNTFGDPNATPEQKILQTDAFIAQKKRDIEAKKLQLGQAPVDEFAGFKVVR